MEQYTTQLKKIIENDVNIFNFNYPIFDETYRNTFQKHFIQHFYYDEIGLETVSKFIDRLEIKLNLIMPYWNKIFLADKLEQRILDNYEIIETFVKDDENITTSNITNKNLNIFSDTPVTKVDFSVVDYATNLSKNNTENEGNINFKNKENWTRKMSGNIGVQTDSDSIVKYWNSLRKIEIEIFKECNDLFMEVY